MNAEHLHDAISLLPEDLLEPVDKLRQRKPIPWKSVAALAACACLVVGLWSLFPGDRKAADNAASIEPGDGYSGILDDIVDESTTCVYLSATILEVTKSHITVLPGDELTDTDVAGPVTVKLDQLETIPALKKGQRIKLYCEEFPDNGLPLTPYRIEIIEDLGG